MKFAIKHKLFRDGKEHQCSEIIESADVLGAYENLLLWAQHNFPKEKFIEGEERGEYVLIGDHGILRLEPLL